MDITPILAFLVGLAVLPVTVVPALTSDIQNTIEARVIVDRWAVDGWKARMGAKTVNEAKTFLTEYISSAFHDLNSIYKGLLISGINLEVRIQEILFLDEPVVKDSPEGSGKAYTWDVADNFRGWLQGQTFSRADHNMLITGLDLCGSSSCSPKGNARTGGMAEEGWSLSIVEFLGGSLVNSMAHELGHSLGAGHDNSECDDSFIMTSYQRVGSRSLNKFRFSQCSIDEFKKLLEKMQGEGNWLSKEKTTAPALSSIPLGKRYTADEMCKLFSEYGQRSQLCRPTVGDYKDICKYVMCQTGREINQCTSLRTAEGLVCGNKKRCSLGQCVESDDAPEVPDNCPQGESSLFLPSLGGTCSDKVPEAKGSCYYDNEVRTCCETCEDVKDSNMTDCEFGDRHNACHPRYCHSKHNRELCCATCKDL